MAMAMIRRQRIQYGFAVADGDAIDFRTVLEGERQRLEAELREAELSGMQPSAWRGESKSRGTHVMDALGEVERALKKLDEGSYGLCEKCQKLIALERLEAKPETRFCVACAR